MDLSERELKFLTLATMAQTLKKNLDAGTVTYSVALHQYNAIRERLRSFDTEVMLLLPPPRSLKTLKDLKLASGQLVDYANSKALPIFLKLMHTVTSLSTEAGTSQALRNPLMPILPILAEVGLTENWAVAACALTLMEVLLNRKLEEMGLSTNGNFNKRLRRLSSRTKEVNLPELLTSAFYDVRSKVIHGGKEPTPEELELIIHHLANFTAKLRELKP
mgnify:CR=1 FL=1